MLLNAPCVLWLTLKEVKLAFLPSAMISKLVKGRLDVNAQGSATTVWFTVQLGVSGWLFMREFTVF